ncbi:MAG TPA: carbohydrate porin [Terracidiphilus sp.]|nr:carbohydrate porin [Terracidiphilus sp.]
MLRNLHPLIGLLLLVVSSVAQGTAPAAAQAIATTEAIPVEFLLAPLLQPRPSGPANGMTHPALGFTWTAQGSNQADEKAGGEKAGKPAVIDDPLLTMFPHPEGARFLISGQANIIFQGRLPFHSAYEGPNSFRGSAEYKTSMVGTLYTAVRPTRSIRYNTDLILDLELAAGRGLSQALGLAGFTNLDVVRNPNLGSAPYLARYGIHQVIGLTSETTSQEPDYFSLATGVPVRRIEFRVGKMTLPDFFDLNEVGSDAHLQFTNWTVDNNGAWDYAADTRGYTVGGIAEYDDRSWSLRYGIFAMPVVANGIDLDWAFSRAHGQNGELELRHSLIPHRAGTTRLLFFANRAHLGVYREAVDAYLNGTDPTPTITNHEHFGALKYGFDYNMEQELSDNLRVFARFGWNEGQHESFAYTEVDQTVEFGGDYSGRRWHRKEDKAGLAVVSNAIKRDHQNYLRYGGLGFLLGDGGLTYGRENIVEGYYNWHAWRGLFYAIDVQHINNPGYNRDRGPAWVGSVRAHVDF